MLLALSIRNFVIVEDLTLEFAPGFTVLTGETGAGKSILIDALLLALGERADADVVREGATRADITAQFRPNAAALDWLRLQDLGDDADLLLTRRSIDIGGRNKAFINGVPATLAQLRELGELLVDVHGQHAHQSLLRPAAQLTLLDEHGGLAPQRAAVALAYSNWMRAQQARTEAEAMAAGAAAEHERLHWIVEELELLAPVEGEWLAIEAEHKRLSHAASLLEGARTAVDQLAEVDGSALSQLGSSSTRLGQLASFDERLQPAVELISGAQAQLTEAVSTLNRYLDRADLDASRLADLEARLAALHGAARKLRATPEALPGMLAAARGQLAALAAASDMGALRTREAESEAKYRSLATELSRRRAATASSMGREVTRAMQDLSMAGGRFVVHLEPGEPAASGIDRIELRVVGHAGASPKPLAKVASGGELARFSLAISVIAATATPVSTLIFDEVDAGIGGAVAETVGRLLKQLGQTRQVLAVTHLPQVAARGDQHFQVNKAADPEGRPVSTLVALERRSRVEELARMLGGVEITDTTRKHAREMLAS
jgi:DNA repair protein RecN (Recombination protein N)